MSKKKNKKTAPAVNKAAVKPEKAEQTVEETVEETKAAETEEKEAVTEEQTTAAEDAPESSDTEKTDPEETSEDVSDEEDSDEEDSDEEDSDEEDSDEEDSDDEEDFDEEDTDDDDDDDDIDTKRFREYKENKEKAAKKERARQMRALKSRAFKKGWFSIGLVAFFIAGVIIVNMIASKLVEKVPALVADTTGSSSFELGDETVDYIKKLSQDIRLIVLCDEKTYKEGGEYYIQADSLLRQYADDASHITLEFVDLAANPTYESLYPDETLSQYSIIVQGENDYRYLKTTDYFDVQIDYTSYSYYIAGSKVEEAVTSAILNVTLDDKPTVSFISGITDQDYSAFMQYLNNNGFETNELSPAIDDISDETDILVLFAPNVDLDSKYVDKISKFLDNGGEYGKQLIFLPGSTLTPMPNIDSLLEQWGLEVERGYAVENDMSNISQVSYGVYLFGTQYTDTTYTELMKNKNLPVCVFYGNGVYTHAIDILDENKASSLLKLSEQSTVIYPAETGDNAEPTEESKPSVAVGAIATKGATSADTDTDSDSGATKSSSSHIVVFGTNYIVTETFLNSNMYGNASYVLSLVNTLVGRDSVGITVETQKLDSEAISISTAQLGIFTLVYMIVLPLAILITGIVIYMKRRNK